MLIAHSHSIKSSSLGINIHQTNSPTETAYNGKGFDSGEKTKSGNFRETFTAPGTYYYSSDSVWNINLYMMGTVIVEADSEDAVLDVKVNMTDIEAFHDLATGIKTTHLNSLLIVYI